MAARVSDIDVIIQERSDEVPNCSHGPTLLFSRFDKDGENQQFYACSAFRDRKECSFFQLKEEKLTAAKIQARKSMQKNETLAYKRLKKRCHKLRKMKAVARVFCESCGQFLSPEERGDHSNHKTTSAVEDDRKNKPSRLFSPLDNNKTYAQYLFSESAVQFTIDLLKKQGITHVLCIGAPRIHEAILCDHQGELESLLLDLDHRYLQVYPPKRFCHYNMFNHHFFNGKRSQNIFTDFMTEHGSKRVAVVTDPPFGGLVEVLASTFNRILKLWKDLLDVKDSEEKQLPMLWFFPYFMEKRIIDCLPHFKMLDYKVDYDNHALFRGDVKKHGSPVRIFTNIPPSQVVLPVEEGYWFCKVCDRYSGAENQHCPVCDSCTSKDGRTYRHCYKCDRCVKPSKIHCEKCKVCQIKDHRCGQIIPQGCHICGELGHKRKSCPNKERSTVKRKNKFKHEGTDRKRRK